MPYMTEKEVEESAERALAHLGDAAQLLKNIEDYGEMGTTLHEIARHNGSWLRGIHSLLEQALNAKRRKEKWDTNF